MRMSRACASGCWMLRSFSRRSFTVRIKYNGQTDLLRVNDMNQMPTQVSTKTPEFTAYYRRLSEKSVAPLWEVLKNIVTPEPVSPAVPAHWAYQDVRPLLFEAGKLITAEQAERRVLVLENPGLKNLSSITHSLY